MAQYNKIGECPQCGSPIYARVSENGLPEDIRRYCVCTMNVVIVAPSPQAPANPAIECDGATGPSPWKPPYDTTCDSRMN